MRVALEQGVKVRTHNSWRGSSSLKILASYHSPLNVALALKGINLKYLSILILLFVQQSSFAAQWTNGKQTVTSVIWRTNYHGFYVDSNNFHDPQGCRTNSTENLYLFSKDFEDSNVKLTDRLYSMILTASTTQKKLHVWVDGCVGQYPKIIGLQLN